LLRRVIQIAKDEKLSEIHAEMLPDNIGMQVIMKRCGFQVRAGEDMSSIQAFLEL